MARRATVAEGLSMLFEEPVESAAAHRTGLLPVQALKALVREKEIAATQEIAPDQFQPASLDLRLGRVAYRVRASFLPGPHHTVEEKLRVVAMHELDLSAGEVLERGCVYLVPLMERLALTSRMSAVANPKSSTGRLDVFTRLITDYASEYDRVAAGYKGPLYAEIAPRTFSILVRPGTRLSQLRVRRGSPLASDRALKALHQQAPLVHGGDGAPDIKEGIAVTIDLAGERQGGLIGFKARKHADLIDADAVGRYDPLDFWEPLYRRRDPWIILDPDEFYIMVSREAVTVPPNAAAEMVPFNPWVGEFRAHYAGFFDPGFGYAEAGGAGSRAVLEIRSREVPFVMEHGQTVARLIYERLTARPERLYGAGIGSNYQAQGLKLSKQFKPFRS